jgi:hypothetical protein
MMLVVLLVQVRRKTWMLMQLEKKTTPKLLIKGAMCRCVMGSKNSAMSQILVKTLKGENVFLNRLMEGRKLKKNLLKLDRENQQMEKLQNMHL